MGRLRVLSGREACRILQQHGFVEVRRRRSHIIMRRRAPTPAVSPFHPNRRELAIGTLLSIIRQSGVARVGVRRMIRSVFRSRETIGSFVPRNYSQALAKTWPDSYTGSNPVGATKLFSSMLNAFVFEDAFSRLTQ
jgi:predicted RNA binding protein YcfA (HicA-like mRNA interferase family)